MAGLGGQSSTEAQQAYDTFWPKVFIWQYVLHLCLEFMIYSFYQGSMISKNSSILPSTWSRITNISGCYIPLSCLPTSLAFHFLSLFWRLIDFLCTFKVTDEIRNMTMSDLKHQELPLARIKKIMKLDDDVKVLVTASFAHWRKHFLSIPLPPPSM